MSGKLKTEKLKTETWTLVTTEDAQPLAVTRQGDQTLVSAASLESATGWSTKPEGFCLGDRCVPAGRAVRDDGQIDLALFAQRLARPLIVDAQERVIALGESASDRSERLQSLAAPDFELPDLSGRIHRLSDYRGRKVLLAAYASW